MEKAHIIQTIQPGSIAQELELEAGDRLLLVNGTQIGDIFDYQYLTQERRLELLIEKADGEQWELEIIKDEEEDLGIGFESGLMDEYRRCRNRCVFCFIDQLPKGMREPLYFKDDDSRLSFLRGNYVTLTNLSEQDVERIIRYRLSPVHISFHTMNPRLRCQLLRNPSAGEALRIADRLYEAEIRMNGQIVLCKGLNDGEELDHSIRLLKDYLPYLESVSVVPVGLTRYREGLYPLEPFGREDARKVLGQIHRWQERIWEEAGTRFVHAGDEWYILAEEEVPEEGRYEGYPQLENGVGMLRLFLEEFEEALEARKLWTQEERLNVREKLTLATGVLAGPYLTEMARRLTEVFPNLDIRVSVVRNRFFGERITVSGLLTGRDLAEQLAGQALGSRLLLPENALRGGEAVFLDDFTVEELEKALQVPIHIVKSSGHDLVRAITDEK